jgi:RNA-directed DNA polymerase
VPWSDDQGRPAKAMNRTADMHVLEKSDCAVVPVNQPNKGGQPSAEAVEGRAQTKEGEHRSIAHAPDTEREAHVPGTGPCGKAARERKQERFTALFHHLVIESIAPMMPSTSDTVAT